MLATGSWCLHKLIHCEGENMTIFRRFESGNNTRDPELLEQSPVRMSGPSTLQGTCFSKVPSSTIDELTQTPRIPSPRQVLCRQGYYTTGSE